jgi:large subunit ribosomal protein L30
MTFTYFRITLLRSAIGLPRRSTDVLKALGLKKRMATVFHPVSPSVAGQIMRVKELVSVQEVEQALTKQQVHLERKPDPGYYVEKSCVEERGELLGQ